MGTWNSRGLRGSALEDMINRTNERYQEKGLALIQKIPTPITPVRIDKEHRHITLAYFDQRSTVDYIGAIQGLPVCFDAKECVADTFPLQNIHAHQVQFMENFEKQGGIAFLIIYYTARNILYYMRFQEVQAFWKRAEEEAGKASALRNWIPGSFWNFRAGSTSLIWTLSTRILACGKNLTRSRKIRIIQEGFNVVAR